MNEALTIAATIAEEAERTAEGDYDRMVSQCPDLEAKCQRFIAIVKACFPSIGQKNTSREEWIELRKLIRHTPPYELWDLAEKAMGGAKGGRHAEQARLYRVMTYQMPRHYAVIEGVAISQIELALLELENNE